MRAFLKKGFLVYLLPVIAYFLLIYGLDPLKCFRSYSDYYHNSFVSPNRENVCLNLFENSDSSVYINSFILGNSCSHAYKTSYWMKFLPLGSKPFHLDGYRETTLGILKKLEYLEKRGNKINNVLLIIDRSIFSKRFKSYMYAMPKKLDKDSSDFYLEHFKALTSVKFMASYLYYSAFHRNLSFMEEYHFSTSQPISDNRTGDLNYLADLEAEKDSKKYFDKLQNEAWTKREKVMDITGNDSYEGLDANNIKLLNEIKDIFKRNNSNYKIVINPLYDEKKVAKEDLSIMENIFGKNNIADFSGVNEITEDFRNFYDGIHYRPKVAEKIMNTVYLHNEGMAVK